MLTLIFGQHYVQGRDWLRDNYKKRQLNPQNCRIITSPDILRGLTEYHLIFLPGWSRSKIAVEVRELHLSRIVPGRKITQEFVA